MSVFYDNFIRLCNRKSVTPSAAVVAIGLSKAAAHAWKHKGSTPTSPTMRKLADYFGVSVDALVAENADFDAINEEKPAPTNGNELLNELLIKRAVLIDKLQGLGLDEMSAIEIVVDALLSNKK